MEALSQKAVEANALMERGDIHGAIRIFKELAHEAAVSLGREHPFTASVLVCLADCHKQLDDYEQAKILYAEACETLSASTGEQRQGYYFACIGVGICCMELQQYKEALSSYQEAMPLKEIIGEQNDYLILCYLDAADCQRHLKAYGEALDLYAVVRRILLAMGLQTDHRMARCHFGYGDAYRLQHNYEASIPHFRQALRLDLQTKGEFHRDTALTYIFLGDSLKHLGQYDEALKNYRQGLLIKTSLREEDSDLARAHLGIGACAMFRGEYDSAHQSLESASVIYLKTVGENHTDTANCYGKLGDVFKNRGNYREALVWYHKVLTILPLIGEERALNHAICLHSLGSCLKRLGAFADAEGRLNEALGIFRAVAGEYDYDTAACYTQLGECAREQGDYGRCVLYLEKAISIFEHPQVREHHNAVGAFLLLALSYKQFDRLDDAEAVSRKAMDYALRTTDAHHPIYAKCLDVAGSLSLRREKYKEAIDFFKVSKDIYSSAHGAEHYEVANCLLSIGICHICLVEFFIALGYLRKALPIFLKTVGKESALTASCYEKSGVCHFSTGNIEDALDCFQLALQSLCPGFQESDIFQNPRLENFISATDLLDVLRYKADALHVRYSSLSAIDFLKASYKTISLAASLIDQIRAGLREESSGLQLAEDTKHVYEIAIRDALELARLSTDEHEAVNLRFQSFTFSEKARSMLLLGGIRERNAKAFAGVPREILAKETLLMQKIAFFDRQISENAVAQEPVPAEVLAEWKEAFFKEKRTLEVLRSDIERDFPDYFKLKYDTSTVGVAELQASLDEESAVLEYFWGRQDAYVFGITQRNFFVEKLDKPVDLPEIIQGLRREIEDMDEHERLADHFDSFAVPASRLYSLLIEPVLKHISVGSTRRLFIVPDEHLALLPFEVLLTDKPLPEHKFSQLPYLLHAFEIGYHCSGTLLWEIRQKERRQENQGFTGDFAGFAPVYKTPPLAVIDGITYRELPDSEKEVAHIAAFFAARGSKTAVFYHSDANRANFIEHAPGKQFLLVSAHHDKERGIVFFPEGPEKQAGSPVFHVQDAYALPLHGCRFVTLSCCETGIGQLSTGEGVLAMNRAFLFAGVSGVLFTLFKVPDMAAATLVRFFFDGVLNRKLQPATALADAKRNLARQGKDGLPPQCWAGFVITGV